MWPAGRTLPRPGLNAGSQKQETLDSLEFGVFKILHVVLFLKNVKKIWTIKKIKIKDLILYIFGNFSKRLQFYIIKSLFANIFHSICRTKPCNQSMNDEHGEKKWNFLQKIVFFLNLKLTLLRMKKWYPFIHSFIHSFSSFEISFFHFFFLKIKLITYWLLRDKDIIQMLNLNLLLLL